MISNKLKVAILEPYMEVIGPFVELVEEDGVLLAEIAKHIVVLPLELKDALTPHLGHWIAILRTDIPGKEYLFRVLTEKGVSQCRTPSIQVFGRISKRTGSDTGVKAV